LGLVFCISSYAADKVGYINLQRLVNESKMGKAAKNDIQKLRQKKETTIKNKLDDIIKLRDFINKEGDKIPFSEKRKKIDKLQNMYKEYQRLVADAKEDITKEDRDLVATILERADGVLKKVAKSKQYTIILKDPKVIGYLDPRVDITDSVLKELNKKK
jgi:outer membrane protein